MEETHIDIVGIDTQQLIWNWPSTTTTIDINVAMALKPKRG